MGSWEIVKKNFFEKIETKKSIKPKLLSPKKEKNVHFQKLTFSKIQKKNQYFSKISKIRKKNIAGLLTSARPGRFPETQLLGHLCTNLIIYLFNDLFIMFLFLVYVINVLFIILKRYNLDHRFFTQKF